ncbi:hypothetical protein BC351_00375 [Paenibacillus ferrarius]|uniref:Fibronectin type-III domain-containing protein n=1 Tax=Paenibacillus ferrarius TaxID=1469647 RepID=A0A1V4HS29_9BACL|nr:LamG-like jellyroll fold domain-containing protein [Paenibacillus ferrarius]OPH61731.1 hypothetical protein BC351_00375 [Paenibacillus ferrarius]
MELTPLGFKKPVSSDSADLRVFVGENMDLLDILISKKEKEIPKQPTPPTSPKTYDLWIDTASEPYSFKMYSGSLWVLVGGSGSSGASGKSAYQVWLDLGNTGTPQQFIDSLKGAQGIQGAIGSQGIQGQKGDQGIQGLKGDQGIQGIQGIQGLKGEQGIQGLQGVQGLSGSGGSGSLNLSTFIVRDTWTVTGTKTLSQKADQLYVNNTGTSDLTISVNGIVIPIKPLEKFLDHFDEFTQVTITASSTFEARAGVGTAAATAVIKDCFIGSTTVTNRAIPSSFGVVVSNDGTSSLTYTINGNTIAVSSGEVVENRFDSFTAITIATTVAFRCYVKGAPVAVTIPLVPTGLTATAGNGQVTLNWTAVSGATSYNVYRGGTKVSNPATNTITDNGLINGTAYSYTVSAVNSAGESAQSSAINSTPLLAIPATPTGLTVVSGDAKNVVTWNVSSGATSYKLYRDGTSIGAPSTNGLTDTGLTNGTSYAYKVSAVNGAGESTQSAVVNGTPSAAPAGKINDASLILYQDNPVTKQTIPSPDTYFHNADQWTVFATIKPVAGAATHLFSRVSPTAVRFEYTYDNHFQCTLTGKIGQGAGSANYPAAVDPTAQTDFNSYHHVVVMRDATKIYIYVDNVLAHSVSNITSDFYVDGSTSPLMFGQNSLGTQPLFKNMGYYNRVLTTAELTQNYNALK